MAALHRTDSRALSPTAASPQSTCWIVTDGAIGNEKQCAALAHYLEVVPEVFRIALRQPWETAAPHLQRGGRRAIVGELAGRLDGPLPDLLISAGRRSTLAATTIRRLSGGRTYTVHVLDPRIDPRYFDLVVCPRHDELTGPNVLTMRGAPHIVDDQTLGAARAQWRDVLEPLPAPRVAVLIGASNRAYTIDRPYLESLAAAAESIAGPAGSLLVTTSRRTPEPLRQFVQERFHGKVWTGVEGDDNPYLGYLAWADHIVVSADSVNMVSEALGTGKPVYCTPPGNGTPKFRRFLNSLADAGMILPLAGGPREAHHEPLRETQEVAAEIRRRWQAAGAD